MSVQQTSQGRRRGVILGAAVLALVAVLVSGAIAVFAQTRGAPQPIAELVPADTHVYISLNTDLTSRGWMALPGLLDALGVEEQVRTEVEDTFAEEGIDFRADVEPLFGTARGAALAVQFPPGLFDLFALESATPGAGFDDEPEVVGIIDTRDPGAWLALFERTIRLDDPDVVITTRRDDGYDFDITEFAGNSAQAMVVARRGDVLYLSEQYALITSLVDRREATGPLSADPEFRRMADVLLDDSLVFGYASTAFFGALPLEELMVLSGQQQPDFDYSTLSTAFSITVDRDGFGMEGMVAAADGFPDVATAAMQPADIGRAAALAPADSLVFFAASGLRETIENMLEAVSGTTDAAFVDDMFAEFELETGVDLRRDVIQQLSGTYAVAFGAADFEMLDMFALVLLESGDRLALVRALGDLVGFAADMCFCDPGVTVVDADGFVQVRWPQTVTGGARLDTTAGFTRTLGLLPANPQGLFYFNPAGLPPDARREMLDAPDINLGAIAGVGGAWTGDTHLMRFRMVVAIEGN